MFLLPEAGHDPAIRYAWRGPALLVVDTGGRAGGLPLTGFWFRQTRFLRDLRFTIGGVEPHPCSIAQISPNELEVAYVHPETDGGDGGGSGSGGTRRRHGLLVRGIDVRLLYRVRPASLEVTVVLTNRWDRHVDVELGWHVAADFVSIEDALFERAAAAPQAPSTAVPSGLELRHGHPALPFVTRVIGGGADWRGSGGTLGATVRLDRQVPRTITLRVGAMDFEDAIDEDGERAREAALARWSSSIAQLDAPGDVPLAEIANRAALDLGSMSLLEGRPDEWLTPAAGLPIYQALWARDALTATWQAGLLDGGALLSHVLAGLARTQGTRDDPTRDEQPGRILNQRKRDPAARLGLSGFDRSYADVASPFMYIIGLGYHYVLTGDRDHVRRRWDTALRIVDWALRDGDRDGDGYIEYLTRAPGAPRHQAWKDSDNAVVRADGSQVDPPIASCEIQGYWYISLQFMAMLSVAMRDLSRAREFQRRAADLKRSFNRDFWMEDEGFIAFGLDADKRQIRALTSNAGQCLPTGIVERARVPRLARRLFQADLFSGWGIRTLSADNPAYNPLDYHLGSVWPVENGSILFGLRRYGEDEHALRLARGLYDLARLWPGGRTPECVGGYGREEYAHPGAFARANGLQAWNRSVWPILVQCVLGLVPFAPLRLLLVDPILPPWLPELTVRRVRVGDATVSLRFRRHDDGRSSYEVLERRGRLRIVRQPWLESLSADVRDRLAGLGRTISNGVTSHA